MPKAAPYLLIWSANQGAYLLYERQNQDQALLRGDEPAWFRWLACHTSFSFQGHSGHLNLQKERRPHGGEGYWYAYRRQGKGTTKKYVGRSAHLSMTCLETIAQVLASPPEASPVPGEQGKAASLAMPLLLPKFQPPSLSSSLVTREHLLTLLDGLCSHSLTLLVAPAGFGKTTLLGQWLTSRRISEGMPPVSWLSLDRRENDPVRFWRYVITACQPFHAGGSEMALARLLDASQKPCERSSLERVLTPLLNALTLPACGGLLILDDYHIITKPVIHETLTFFLDHLPASVHVVLLSRYEAPLPLARWRGSGAVLEIQGTDLRFSAEETATFFQQTLAFPLSKETLHKVNMRLEGWAAGLRLLTLTLQGRSTSPEVEQSLLLLEQARRPILDYFLSEVLSAQPKPFQHFLFQTSILSCLNSSLCDAVTGRQDSSQLLEQAERSGLFLQPLGGSGQWYRYHELFAEALQHEARRRLGEEALHTLSLRACRWYETHDLLDEAIETALAIHDYVYAAVLLERVVATKRSGEWHHTFHRWLVQLPQEILWAHPTLCFLYVMAYLFVKDRSAPATRAFLEGPLQEAERSWRAAGDQPKLGAVYTLRSLIAWWQDEYTNSFAAARQALALLPEHDIHWRGMSLLQVGMEDQLAGHFRAAQHTLIEARTLCARAENIPPMIAATLALGNLCTEQGMLQQAEYYYRQALAEAGEQKNMLGDQGFAWLGLAQLAYEWNDVVSAKQKASQALNLGRQLQNQLLQTSSVLALARILHAQGEGEHVQQLLQELVPQIHKPGLLRALLLGQAQLTLACGDLATAQRWLPARLPDGALLPFIQHEQERLFQVRLLLAQGAGHEALALLHDWQREAGSRGDLENLILSALAHAQLASREEPASDYHQSQANQLLLRALALAQPGAFQRLFLDEGEPLAVLLRTILPDIHDAALYAYVCTLVLAFAKPVGVPGRLIPASHSLSVQEQRILHLLAGGHTKAAIAQELVVSLNTIKTHVKSIYRKLGATSRQEALAKASALHLLS